MFAQSLSAWRETFVLRRVAMPPVRRSSDSILDEDVVWSYSDSAAPQLATCPVVVVAVPGVGGDETSFFRVQLWLHNHGVRCIALALPAPVCASHATFCEQFRSFLQRLALANARVCLLGSMLGSYLAQCYAAAYPQDVTGLVLCSAWTTTAMFRKHPPLGGFADWAPEFVLKRKLLGALPGGELESNDADAVDHLVGIVERLSRDQIVTRLALMCAKDTLDTSAVVLERRRIAVVVADDGALPLSVQQAAIDTYAGCRVCTIKSNSEFLFILSAYDELAMHVLVHLRSFAVDHNTDDDAAAAAAAEERPTT